MMVVITIVSVSAFSQTQSKKQQSTATSTVYTCSMHPEVCSNKAGKCSKCGMDLTKIKTCRKLTHIYLRALF